MFRLTRRPEICSIGHYTYTTTGRPTDDSSRKWVAKCNFVFKIVAKMALLNPEPDMYSNWGWLVRCTYDKDSVEELYMKCEDASSSANLKRFFMKSLSGAVCRMQLDDFLAFVQEDVSKDLPTIYLASHCGKLRLSKSGSSIWAFPHIITDGAGNEISSRYIVMPSVLSHRSNGDRITLPSILPKPLFVGIDQGKSIMKELGVALLAYYGPRFPHAVHLLSSVLKSIHRDTLIELEHQVSITNISGPANVGKTFACAIALKMLNAESLMLSRCTSSAMLDATHVFRNMLVVWDDPRDASSAQLCSIVHECFHGHTTSTNSRGNRAYNSSLIIGTQDKLLGLPCTEINLPTFTRLSHIDMHIDDEYRPSKESELALQKLLPKIPYVFKLLLQTSCTQSQINKYHKILQEVSTDVVDRSLRTAAIDWYFCEQLVACGLGNRDAIRQYFKHDVVRFLEKYCGRTSLFLKFCNHIKTILDHPNIPRSILKRKVTIDLKNYGPKDCIALHTKTFFDWLHVEIPESTMYTSDAIHSEIRLSKGKLGDVSRNVSYKLDRGMIVQRSMLIRLDVLHAM